MIPQEILRKVRRIELATRSLVEDIFAGEYHSVFKGRGMEFAEVREYIPGDDIRAIDWNVTARMRQPFVKIFDEERELTVMLLVDLSGSTRFGSGERSKGEIAAEISALLAFSAIKNNDRVGLIMFTDRIERFVPPKKGTKHVLRVISEVLSFVPQSSGTDIAGALEFLSRVTKRKSVAFLVSDFLASGYESALKVAHRRHDLVSIVLRDPMERSLPAVGIAALQDAESGETILFDTTSRRAREKVADAVEALWQEQRKQFKQNRIDFVELATDRDYVRPLVMFFKHRAARMAR